MIFLRLFTGYFVQIIPFAVLGLYPFSSHFRFSIRKTCLITLGLIFTLDSIFSGAGTYLRTVLPADSTLFSAVDILFFTSLIPCFLWVLYASKSIWQKKLFVFSFLLSSAFFMISVCNMISTCLKLDIPADGLPYKGYSLLVILLFTVLITPLLLLILKKGYIPLADSLTKKESSYFAVFSLVLFLFLVSTQSIIAGNFYNSAMIFLYGALLATVFFIYVIFFRILALSYEKMTARQESDYLKHQLEVRDEQYHRFNDSIEQNRRMHHDLKHHMLTIRGFINEGKLPEAEQYLEHCVKLAENYEITKLCDVPVINWIVSYYQALAKNKEIPFSIRISAPPVKDISLPEADLSVLLGNLLENAVTTADSATGDDRYICLNITHSGNMLVITVDNGYCGTLKTDGREYLSTKNEHNGIGLRSIRNIAEKNNGGVEFTHEANVFHSSVMLAIRPDTAS